MVKAVTFGVSEPKKTLETTFGTYWGGGGSTGCSAKSCVRRFRFCRKLTRSFLSAFSHSEKRVLIPFPLTSIAVWFNICTEFFKFSCDFCALNSLPFRVWLGILHIRAQLRSLKETSYEHKIESFKVLDTAGLQLKIKNFCSIFRINRDEFSFRRFSKKTWTRQIVAPKGATPWSEVVLRKT